MSAPITDGTLERIARRAEWALEFGKACIYQMGAGNSRAGAATPWDGQPACDCSALADWCAGIDKHGPASPAWQNTDALVNDGLQALKVDLWHQLPAPVRGCLIVYGGHVGADGKRHAGHVGVVVDVINGHCIDCSSTKNGIGRGVHSVAFFLRHGAICIAPNGAV